MYISYKQGHLLHSHNTVIKIRKFPMKCYCYLILRSHSHFASSNNVLCVQERIQSRITLHLVHLSLVSFSSLVFPWLHDLDTFTNYSLVMLTHGIGRILKSQGSVLSVQHFTSLPLQPKKKRNPTHHGVVKAMS